LRARSSGQQRTGEPCIPSENGRWLLTPRGDIRRVKRWYHPGTLISETECETADGVISLLDFMPTDREIAARAYDRYLTRGCVDGRDFDDWLDAERELNDERRQQLVSL
jgi:hypothetical protein